ncbi:MAG: baseplate J/gp47 family protein [Sporomusaceae bacterium]|nr:baseplate J/gp47 family protein [Sporomusaceae bacterium]
MEFKNLPQITFAERSAGVTEAALIAKYEEKTKKTLYPGDPVRLLLEAVAFMFAQVRNEIDYTGKQNLLAYAVGDNEDHLGVLVGTDRLPAAAATATLRFTLSAAQAGAVIIPAGTRATPGDNLLFATTATATIPAGQTYVDAEATCIETGAKGNDYAPGQINKIVDPIQWVASVTNTTTSEGGADIESDDAYRQRIRLAPESFSTAGPGGAYEYHAKKASALIVDVSVISPDPGEVEIRPLLAGGEIPGQEVLDAVTAACNDKSVRPLTDLVSVLAPTVVSYDVDATYWIDSDNSTVAATIQAAVEQAVADWVLWQKSKLGRDINPSELNRRMVNAGGKRVLIASPAYTALLKSQVAVAGTVAASFGGFEDG